MFQLDFCHPKILPSPLILDKNNQSMEIIFNQHPQQFKEGVQELAEIELKRLLKIYSRIERADIYYKAHKDPANPHEVEIKLAVPGDDLFAHKAAESYSKAFNLCVDKLASQLARKKSIMNDVRK